MQEALEAQLAEIWAAHALEVAALVQQLEEAHRLADFSSRELAGVVQQLAAVRCWLVLQAAWLAAWKHPALLAGAAGSVAGSMGSTLCRWRWRHRCHRLLTAWLL